MTVLHFINYANDFGNDSNFPFRGYETNFCAQSSIIDILPSPILRRAHWERATMEMKENRRAKRKMINIIEYFYHRWHDYVVFIYFSFFWSRQRWKQRRCSRTGRNIRKIWQSTWELCQKKIQYLLATKSLSVSVGLLVYLSFNNPLSISLFTNILSHSLLHLYSHM